MITWNFGNTSLSVDYHYVYLTDSNSSDPYAAGTKFTHKEFMNSPSLINRIENEFGTTITLELMEAIEKKETHRSFKRARESYNEALKIIESLPLDQSLIEQVKASSTIKSSQSRVTEDDKILYDYTENKTHCLKIQRLDAFVWPKDQPDAIKSYRVIQGPFDGAVTDGIYFYILEGQKVTVIDGNANPTFKLTGENDVWGATLRVQQIYAHKDTIIFSYIFFNRVNQPGLIKMNHQGLLSHQKIDKTN